MTLLPRTMWVILLLALSCSVSLTEAVCEFEAIFNFGDSNSDTGGFYAAFPAQSGSFGMTYFKKPSGRASDGRLVVDFLDYKHGANYATLASTVLLPNTSLFVSGISPFSLAIQLNQMKEFKVQVLKKGPNARLPAPVVFGKSLFTFDIGQNDFTSNLASIGIEGTKQFLPQVVAQIVETIKALFAEGGRTFLVSNLAPIGCYPAFLTELPHNSSDLDEFGCMISYNGAVTDYNNMLRDKLHEAAGLLPNASVIYVDTHSVKLELFRHPRSHGLKYGTKACCGYGGDPYNYNKQLYCGNSREINGSLHTASACSDPQNYVSWDGIHATEAANRIVTRAILSGFYFEPPFPLSKLCDLHPIVY
ncbi:GDSL esterase/lipase At4g01130-like isoform X2 [Aristolochia californica]|uniref:GDSL esterase/lipase At4g01130-like isoform X2 n=1 Tax=Aristolochia californica TaxID=171875 RepID=UPI0035E162F6